MPYTYYQRPGLVVRAVPPTAGQGRLLYQATNGDGYAIVGDTVYKVESDWSMTSLGTVTPGRSNICSMIDDGNVTFIVDGSSNGWTSNLISPYSFAQIVDPTGTFTGADKVDFMDTFFLFNQPRTQFFGSSLSNSLTFDPLYIAGKTDYADNLMTLFVNRHELLLLGALKSEIWYDAGNPLFPFAELPGAYIEHGVAAIYSPASQDISVYWLSRNLQGQGMVMRQRGYQTTDISNYALGEAVRKMWKTVGISDAIGFTFQQGNHVFYVLTFPAGNQTWVWDESIGDPLLGWSQWAWTNPADGSLNRHRAAGAAFINGVNACIDWENGTIYEMDMDTYTDEVNGQKGPISCIRTFPHIGTGVDERTGQLMEYDGRRMQVHAFIADFEVGTAEPLDTPQQLSLRWSTNRGRTWGNPVMISAGEQGEYDIQPIWRNLGISRYPLFELSHSINGPAAMNGAWIDVKILGT